VVVFLLVVAACSPDPIEADVEPARAETCADLIPTGTALAVQLLAAIELTSIDVLTGEEAPQGALADLIEKGRQFDERASSLGCDLAELNVEIMKEVGDVDSESLAGQILIRIMQGGVGSGS